jgi:hypothetical protein
MSIRDIFKLLLSSSLWSLVPEVSSTNLSPRMKIIFSVGLERSLLVDGEDVFSSFLLVDLYSTPFMLIITRLVLEGEDFLGDCPLE